MPRFDFVEASDLIPLLSVQYDTRVEFPDFPELGVSEVFDAVLTLSSGIFDLEDRPAWPGPAAGEQWVLPLLPPFIDPFFVFDLNADRSGLAGGVPAPDAPLNFGDALTWSIDEQGGLIIRREFNPDFVQWRRWERLSDIQGSGDFYLRESTPLFVERKIDDAPTSDPPDFVDYRVNFYQVRAIPD